MRTEDTSPGAPPQTWPLAFEIPPSENPSMQPKQPSGVCPPELRAPYVEIKPLGFTGKVDPRDYADEYFDNRWMNEEGHAWDTDFRFD